MVQCLIKATKVGAGIALGAGVADDAVEGLQLEAYIRMAEDFDGLIRDVALCGEDGSGAPDEGVAASGASFRTMRDWLKAKTGGDDESVARTGLIRTQATSSSTIAWVLPKHVERYKQDGDSCLFLSRGATPP